MEDVMKNKALLFILVILFCSSGLFGHQETRELKLGASGLDFLRIDAGGGFLKIVGEEGRDSILVSAEIILEGKNERQAQDFIRKNVRLELSRQGEGAVLISQIKSKFGFSWRTQVIDLTVYIPSRLALDIDDGSGEMFISRVKAKIRVDDGSGEIKIEHVRGDVSVDDGSGSIEIEDVQGNVSIDDGSGTISVRNVTQNVEISDGSGTIKVDSIGGDVIVKDDGSGSIRIQDVKGRVIRAPAV